MKEAVNAFQSHSKVFHGIVHQLKEMISNDGLQPGDKLPSERELSDRLSVGRSSVREALRALELLGLIETRRGEGTFIRDFRNHTLVDLLGMFILQDERAKKDVSSTMSMIEKESIHLLIANKRQVLHLEHEVQQAELNRVSDFFQELVKESNNFLLYRIWFILKDYSLLEKGEVSITDRNRSKLLSILHAINQQDEKQALLAYDQFLNIVE